MFTASLILVMLQAVSQPPDTQRIDATSEATFERTVSSVQASLPEPQRRKFDQAIVLLMGDFFGKLGDDHTQDETLAQWRRTLHGKTARDVLVSAEVLVRSLLEEHEREQANVVSRPMPVARAALGGSFSCQALLSTSIQPEHASDAEYYSISETSFMKSEVEISKLIVQRRLEAKATIGTDKLAIEIHGKDVKFMTRASVEAGQATGMTFTVARNDEALLVAFALQEELLGTTAHSLLLNRENGLAVWTKSRPTFLIDHQPDVQAFYLLCK
jgi:hypothetical protein